MQGDFKHIQTLMHIGNYVAIVYCFRLILLCASKFPVMSPRPSQVTEAYGAITYAYNFCYYMEWIHVLRISSEFSL